MPQSRGKNRNLLGHTHFFCNEKGTVLKAYVVGNHVEAKQVWTWPIPERETTWEVEALFMLP